MAAESIALGALLQVLFEKATNLIPVLIAQFNSLTGINLDEELTKLTSILETIQAVLKDAEERQVREEALRLWLKRLERAARVAEDILDEFHWEFLRHQAEAHVGLRSKVSRFFSSQSPIFFNHRMKSQIRNVVKRLDSIAEQRSKFHLSTCNSRRHGSSDCSWRETHSFVIESEVIGRREDTEKIVRMLISADKRDSLSIVPIVGMGGIGKTTLAQMVCSDCRVKDHFQLMMWVCVSDDFNLARLAEKIIESGAGNRCNGSSMDSLQRHLQETLSLKRYLLVLDDMWNEDASKWEQLRVLLSHGAKGSVILVTTRSLIVAYAMGAISSAYKLNHLSDDDCWTLFKEKAFASGTEEEHPNLVKIGRKIVKKLGGLPLAAKTVGSFMRHKREEREWFSVMESEIWNTLAGGNKILPALRLSYDHLPSHLKQCFAYCSIFPKGYNFKEELLIQLWMANGLIPCRGNLELEDEGHEIFNELVSWSFLQGVEEVMDWNHNITTPLYKMHNLVYDLAQAISKNECCILGEKTFKGSHGAGVYHVSVNWNSTNTGIDKIMNRFSKSLRTLFKINYSRSNFKASQQRIWFKARYLRVLALPSLHLQEVPGSIGNLKHLRYLDLSDTEINVLPEATCRLFHLQTLSLEHCRNLCELPKGLKNMTNLRHLLIGGCTNLTCMPRGMGNLIYLQTLSMYVSGSTACCGSIQELKSLVLEWSSRKSSLIDEEVLECLQPHKNIKQLRLSTYWGTSFSNWMMTCGSHLPNLVRVVLCNCCRVENLPPLGQLCFLESLDVSKLDEVKCIGNNLQSAGGIFPSLKQFKLSRMHNLEEWLVTEPTESPTFFPQLVDLQICDCPNLKTMPHLPSIRTFSVVDCPLLLPPKRFFVKMNSLSKLYMEKCHKLAALLTKEDFTSSSTSPGNLEFLDIISCFEDISLHEEFVHHLSSLKSLNIRNCSCLIGGARGMQLQHLSSLKTLIISECGSLTDNIVLDLPQSPSLKDLILNANFIHILPEDLSSLTSLKSVELNSLHKLTYLPGSLGCLTALEYLEIKSCTSLVSLPQSIGCLAKLEQLSVESCINLVSLPNELGNLVSLKKLAIADCCCLSVLPQSLGSLVQLKVLSIEIFPELASLPEGMEGLRNLEKLSIHLCPKLASLPEGLRQQLPRLKSLQISSCAGLQTQFAVREEYQYLISQIPRVKIDCSRSINQSTSRQLLKASSLGSSSCGSFNGRGQSSPTQKEDSVSEEKLLPTAALFVSWTA